MENSKTLILIDGHALAFRQYFALERTGMKNGQNEPTWAVYGFFKCIFDLLKNKNLKPDSICVAFDVGRHTFRVEMYDDYKANRETMPDTLRSQISLIVEGLQAFNIPIYTKEGYEADDVIGTIATKASELGHKTYILTGDQDSFQLIDKAGLVSVLIPSKGELIEYDWERVYQKLGVYPDQVIDYKGLRGDTSDNIPGVRGIGEKTAQKLLNEYKTMENLFANCEQIQGNSIRQKICDGKEIAKLSQELATIIRNVDIDFNFEETHIELPDVSTVTEFLKRMQFYSFLKNIDDILGNFDKNNVKSVEKVAAETNSVEPILSPQTQDNTQLGLFAQQVKSQIEQNNHNFEKISVTQKEDLENLVKELENAKLFSLDTETTSLNVQEAELVGISLALSVDDAMKSYYIPLFHQVGVQLELDYVIETLKPIFENFEIKKTLQNAKFDYCILKNYDVKLDGIVFDTMLASYIKDPSRKHGLKTQALEHLNYMMQEITELIGTGKNQLGMETVSIEDATNYACADAYATLELTKYWKENLDEKELNLLYDVEIPVSLVLAEMEYLGVCVDVDYLKNLTDEFSNNIQNLEEKIYEIAGEKFNVNSPKQVGEILFEKLGLKSKKKRGKNKYSTSAEILEELSEENEICKYLLQHRKFSKLKSTYTEALPELIAHKDGRIHTSYNQTIAVTGRLSSSNPNLQNIPIRTAEGNKIRNAFVAHDHSNYILSSDYSQIELRLLAHCSKDDNLIDAFCQDEDVHALTAAKVYEVPIEAVTKEMRYKAKAVNFGIIYGQSKYGLAKALNIAPFAAEMFIEKYFATYPKVREYMQKTIQFAHENGYVETMFGRKRYLMNDLASPNHNIRESAERAAINQPLQGAAADLIKMAMIELDKKLREKNLKSKLIMQVHDELILEVSHNELELVKEITQQAMELNQPLLVPLVVDINYGKSWLEQ